MDELVKLFIAGITLANGPCLFICAPIVIPCIGALPCSGGDSRTWRTGLKFVLVFSISRLTAYALLGFFSVAFYRFVFGMVAPAGVHIKALLGILVIVVGIASLFRKRNGAGRSSPSCGRASPALDERSAGHIALFGLLVGLSPCPPLLAVLTYIAATSGSAMGGLFSGAVFGLGTVITPLIPMAVFTGFLMDRSKRFGRVHLAVRVLSAAILVYLGLNLIFG